MKRLPRNRIIVGDARDILRTLPAGTIDCAVTSPPYFRLRNYQDERQIGLEAHVDDYTHELLGVARSLKRVLKPSGSLWLNLGDTYSRSDLPWRSGEEPRSGPRARRAGPDS